MVNNGAVSLFFFVLYTIIINSFSWQTARVTIFVSPRDQRKIPQNTSLLLLTPWVICPFGLINTGKSHLPTIHSFRRTSLFWTWSDITVLFSFLVGNHKNGWLSQGSTQKEILRQNWQCFVDAFYDLFVLSGWNYCGVCDEFNGACSRFVSHVIGRFVTADRIFCLAVL